MWFFGTASAACGIGRWAQATPTHTKMDFSTPHVQDFFKNFWRAFPPLSYRSFSEPPNPRALSRYILFGYLAGQPLEHNDKKLNLKNLIYDPIASKIWSPLLIYSYNVVLYV